jgi:putative tryptophan/tyrosine transport system substrate-binding protein
MRRIGLAVVLAVSLAIVPLVAEAQQSGKMYRIGVLETMSATLNTANLDAFRQGLRELGYEERRDFVIEYRSADGRPERFPGLATELVRLKVDLIVTRGTPAVLAAEKATGSIPIVMATSADPTRFGIVSSLARPGGNVTGLSTIAVELAGKRLELLKEAIPRITRIALLGNMSNPASTSNWRQIEVAARSLGLEPQLLDVRVPEDFARAFDTAIKHRADAVQVTNDTLTQTNLRRIVDLSAKHRLPSIFASREFVDAGGLMAYGPNFTDLYRRAATYVDKILKGAKPADLPIEQPTKFELVINLKTAKALGLTIPQSLLVRADELIQ